MDMSILKGTFQLRVVTDKCGLMCSPEYKKFQRLSGHFTGGGIRWVTEGVRASKQQRHQRVVEHCDPG
jgi:hypothetical protein